MRLSQADSFRLLLIGGHFDDIEDDFSCCDFNAQANYAYQLLYDRFAIAPHQLALLPGQWRCDALEPLASGRLAWSACLKIPPQRDCMPLGSGTLPSGIQHSSCRLACLVLAERGALLAMGPACFCWGVMLAIASLV